MIKAWIDRLLYLVFSAGLLGVIAMTLLEICIFIYEKATGLEAPLIFDSRGKIFFVALVILIVSAWISNQVDRIYKKKIEEKSSEI